MVEDNFSPGTEHRFTGLYRPVGIDNPRAERCGAHCDVVGYDLDLERGVPLTFLVRFDDGFETHVFPEEIDDVSTFPIAPPRTPARESSADVELLKTEQARYLREEILASRVERYRSLLWDDRFDGTPNSNHREGEEGALRAFADESGFWVPDGRETEAAALAALEEAHPDSEDVARFAETLRAGLEWEGRG